MSQRNKTLLRVCLTVLLAGILASRLELRELWQTLASASLLLLGAAVLIQAGALFLSVYRWQTIIENFGILTPYPTLVKITFIGFFFNLFLPSGIGGDFFRAYYLSKREKRGMSTTLTTTILERSAGLCALLIIGVGAAAWQDLSIQGVRLFLVFAGVIVVYLFGNLMLFHSWMHRRISAFLRRRGLDQLGAKMELVYDGLNALRTNKPAIVRSLAVSLIIQFLAVTMVWVTARAIRIDAPFQVFLIFVPLINLSIMVPLTINGIGLREGLYFLLFSHIGVSMEVSVSLSLMTFFLYIVTALPGLVLYSLYKREEHLDQLMMEAEGV